MFIDLPILNNFNSSLVIESSSEKKQTIIKIIHTHNEEKKVLHDQNKKIMIKYYNRRIKNQEKIKWADWNNDSWAHIYSGKNVSMHSSQWTCMRIWLDTQNISLKIIHNFEW